MVSGMQAVGCGPRRIVWSLSFIPTYRKPPGPVGAWGS